MRKGVGSHLPPPRAHLPVQPELSDKPVRRGADLHGKVCALQSSNPKSESPRPRGQGLGEVSNMGGAASQRYGRGAHTAPREEGLFLCFVLVGESWAVHQLPFSPTALGTISDLQAIHMG